MNEPQIWYYYLHTNGNLIGRNPVVVDMDPEYFNSPFVQKYWRVDLTDRGTVWRMILEALAKGARINRVKELAKKWGMDLKDAIEMLKRERKPNHMMIGGLEIFIEKIFEKDPDEFWGLVKDPWRP